ncbi:MAG: carboxypeptidase-like regulatory domain-containing protein [Bacteroidales bacterium]|nr:carboxypeptidase-like regulatory domain-containing protein [Bacteroidales bacterium]
MRRALWKCLQKPWDNSFISVAVALLLSCASLSAQTELTIKGTVTDEEGLPLSGCIVFISETEGTVTDSSGHYSLPIPNDKTVEIHYECLGYEEVVLTYSPENAFPLNPDVVLKIDPTLLDYVIIEDPSPTPVRRVEPPTSVTDQEINLAEETTPGALFTVGAAEIPHEVEYITLYTQIGKGGVSYPYVIRFGDETGRSRYRKQEKKVFKRIKKTPVESIQFEGFELVSVGNMADDAAAQHASAVVKAHGLHDYGVRTTPVYYYERKK